MTISGIHKPKNQRALTLQGFLFERSLILLNLALNSNLFKTSYSCACKYRPPILNPSLDWVAVKELKLSYHHGYI